MLGFSELTIYEQAKCYFTYGRLGHLDPKQLPTAWKSKGKPWTTLLAQDFVRRVDLILSNRSWSLIKAELLASTPVPEFHRITMSLAQMLEGDFFTEFVKIGDVIMTSRGRHDTDNVFTLKDGRLTMFLDKETYERAGLVGKPYGAKGNRGLKPRWVVEFDLRSPSMFKGKKGFDRLVYASKNVLNEPLTWLFCNLYPKAPSIDPFESLDSVKCTASPIVSEDLESALPDMKALTADLVSGAESQELPEALSDIYEWLSLIRLQSPRVSLTDSVDPFISRYHLPTEASEQSATQICTVTWEGLLPPAFAQKLLVDVITRLPSRDWVALSMSSFSQDVRGDGPECTFFRPPETPGEYLLWEVRSHQQ